MKFLLIKLVHNCPLKLLKDTVIFFNKITIKRASADSLLLLINRPLYSVNAKCVSAQKILPHFLIRTKDSLKMLLAT